MPRPRPPYLSHERNRLGTPVWYVRIRGKRIRIRETYGTPEFDAAYEAAISGNLKQKQQSRHVTGSLQWLIDQYRESKATQRQRNNIFRGMWRTTVSRHGKARRSCCAAKRATRAAITRPPKNVAVAWRRLSCHLVARRAAAPTHARSQACLSVQARNQTARQFGLQSRLLCR